MTTDRNPKPHRATLAKVLYEASPCIGLTVHAPWDGMHESESRSWLEYADAITTAYSQKVD